MASRHYLQGKVPPGILHMIPANANLTKSNQDANKVYLTYTWELGTPITGYPAKWVSVLSADYLTRTLTIYGDDKTTVLAMYTFTRTLDTDGNLQSEVLN